MATFAGIMYSQPSVFQSTALGQLGAATQTVSAALQVYQAAANLNGSFAGSAQQAQSGQSQTTIGKVSQVVSTLNSVQTTVSSSATQMQALKTRLTTVVTAARGIGFIVTPAGQVLLAGWMYNPYTVAGYKALAAAFQAQIKLVVMQATAVDIQKGLAFAKVAIDLISAISHWDASGPTAPASSGGGGPDDVGSGTPPAPTIPGAPGSTGDDVVGVGGGLAGAGALGGASAIAGGMAGGGAIGGTGIGGPVGAGSVATLGPGLAGGGVGAVVGTAGPAGSAGRGGSPAPVMGVGGMPMAGAAAQERERAATAWMLTEDQDVFAVPGLPATDDGVLS